MLELELLMCSGVFLAYRSCTCTEVAILKQDAGVYACTKEIRER